MRVALIILCFVARSFAGDSNTPALFKLADVMPSGRCEIEFMTIQLTDRANELTLKLQAAIATNQDWFREQFKQRKPGQPLDYDPRFGITKEEYAEFLREVEHRHMVSTGTKLPCIFRWKGDILSLDVGDTNSPLNKIRLNTKSGELFASVGRVGTPIWESSDDPITPIGAYDGCEWAYKKENFEDYNVRQVRLEIWRLKPSGKILWRFSDSEIVYRQVKHNFDVAFQHSPKSTQPDGTVNGSQLDSLRDKSNAIGG